MKLRVGVWVCVLAFSSLVPVQAATVGLDAVIVNNGVNTVFADGFDDGVFSTPPWAVLTGAPGPEAGTELEMHGDDSIFAGVALDPAQATLAFATISLLDFPAGSSVSLLLYGIQPGDFLALGVSPDTAVLADENGALNAIPLAPGATANLTLLVDGLGGMFASVNDVEVFVGASTVEVPVGVGVNVVPEPSTIALMGMGLLAGIAHRRRAFRRK